MGNTNILPSSIDSFEEYEKLKVKIEIFENAAKEVIRQHQLSTEPLAIFSEGTNIVFGYSDHLCYGS